MNVSKARAIVLGCLLATSGFSAHRTVVAQDRDLSTDDWSPMMKAARSDDWKSILLMIDQGADRDAKAPSTGMTALMVAAWYESEETLDVLAFNRADPNVASRKGVTALMIAAGRGNLTMVDTLLQWKAAVDPVDSMGSNALMLGVSAGNPEVVTRLIEAGADVDYRDKKGATPLMLAASKGDKEVINALLEAGADTTIQDDDGFTAAKVAEVTEHEDLVALLTPGRPRQPSERSREKKVAAAEPPPFRSAPAPEVIPDRAAEAVNDPPDGWVVYRSRAAGVRAAFPDKPEETTEPIDTLLGPAEDHTLSLDHDEVSYTVGRTIYPEAAAELDDEAFFAQLMREAMFEGRHELVRPAEPIRMGAWPGRSVRYLSRSGRKRFETWIEAFRDGRTGFLIAVNTRDGRLDEDQARAFFRNFKVLDPTETGTGTVVSAPTTPTPAVPIARDWKVFEAPKAGARAQFPSPFESKSYSIPHGQRVEASRYAQGQPFMEIVVLLLDTPEKAREAYMDHARTMRWDADNVVQVEEIEPFPGWTGLEARLKYTFTDEPPLIERKRVYHDGGTRVVLLRVNQVDNDPADLAARFFGSLELIPIAAPTTPTPTLATPTPSVAPVAKKWTTFRSETYGYRIDFPARPENSKARLPGAFATELVDADLGPIHLRVFWSVDDKEGGPMSARATYEETLEKTRATGKTQEDRELTLGAWTGRSLVSSDTFAEPPTIERQRVFWDGHRTFARLSVVAPASTDTSAIADRFFGSFRLPDATTGTNSP